MAKEAYKYPFYVRGNSSRGEEVIKLLEDRGGKNKFCLKGTQTDGLYYIDIDGCIQCEGDSSNNGIFIEDYFEELHLPEPEWTPQRGETVLAYKPSGIWVEAIFSFKKDNQYFMVGGRCFGTIKKFDENLLGT